MAASAGASLRRSMSRSRSLEYDPAKGAGGAPTVFQSNAAPVPCGRGKDAAGFAFHDFALRQRGCHREL